MRPRPKQKKKNLQIFTRKSVKKITQKIFKSNKKYLINILAKEKLFSSGRKVLQICLKIDKTDFHEVEENSSLAPPTLIKSEIYLERETK